MSDYSQLSHTRMHRFHVVPRIPAALDGLHRLALNLWWTWNPSAKALLARVDPELFRRSGENPIVMLSEVSSKRLADLADDPSFVRELEAQNAALERYLTGPKWFDEVLPDAARRGGSIAYFSMEFGIHECLPVYSGGLGVLAGDHLKSASDLGVPLVGIGIAFSLGYFRQTLDPAGWQAERYPENDWHDLPVSPVLAASGERVYATVRLPDRTDPSGAGREVFLQAWLAQVGRVPLYLLDANVSQNRPEDRALTNTLYGGDRDHRIRQEILLGVGGVRLLEAMGHRPDVCHMNEGHSAFLAIERVRQLMKHTQTSFALAREIGAASNVFTTHTPVPAGNDAFRKEQIKPYLPVLAEGLGKTDDEMMRLGKSDPDSATDDFSMPVLAIRMADHLNGVSELHGREARAMWRHLWPGTNVEEAPIGAVTNGVHVRTWVAPELAELYQSLLGDAWAEGDAETWSKVDRIPDEVLWRAHETRRHEMVKSVRRRLAATGAKKGTPIPEASLDGVLDPAILTIGFARRFATYKRATLLLRDPERLARILGSAERPVQLVFSGKAHPQDFGGKELIKELVEAAARGSFSGRIVFLEDYEMGVARDLVAGVDVWLNTPRRPLEASGTSGMKACMNGALHASILDGWWAEGYEPGNGFAIGTGEEYADAEHGDRIEAEALYRMLEDEIVPIFYDRDHAGLPRRWIAMMKKNLASVFPRFNTGRMVRNYATGHYIPAMRRVLSLCDNELKGAKDLLRYKERMASAWKEVAVLEVRDRSASHEESTIGGPRRLAVGDRLEIAADLQLGELTPNDVSVELCTGRIRADGSLTQTSAQPMRLVDPLGEGRFRYLGHLDAKRGGEHAFIVRVLPHHADMPNRFTLGLLTWG
jgi:glycogen phosphorylase